MPIDPADWERFQQQINAAIAPAVEAARRISEMQLEPVLIQLQELGRSPAMKAFDDYVNSPAYDALIASMPDLQDLPWPQFMEQVAVQNASRLEVLAEEPDDDVRDDVMAGLKTSVAMFVFMLLVLYGKDVPAAELVGRLIDSITDALVALAVTGAIAPIFLRRRERS